MDIKKAILLISILAFNNILAQNGTHFYKPIIINKSLPDTIRESSALLFSKGNLWTINDGGNPPCIFSIDTLGHKVNSVICLKNTQNVDWEAITSSKSHLFIADIGNNKGIRNQFHIYKFKNEILNSKNETTLPEIITFSYKKFTSTKYKTYSQWDAEAIVCINDTLVLFNKNWEEPYCFLYFLPAIPNEYEIVPSKRIYLDGLVTDACYNNRTKALILIGYKDFIPFIYHFKNFELSKINIRNAKRYNFPQIFGVQTEGVCFVNDSTIYFSSEYNPATNGALYKMFVKY